MKCNSFIKDRKLSKKRVKLTNTQLDKLKSAVKQNKKGTIWRINKKNFEGEELPHF